MPAAISSHSLRLCLVLLLAGLVVATALLSPATALQFDASHIQQTAQARYGQRGAQAVARWMAMLSQHSAAPEPQQLRVVNDFWNSAVLGGEDRHIWGQNDYWATPLETLGQRAGDCEDFVIGKYFSLVHMGVPAEKLRFIYVRARMGGIGSSTTIAHMVLG
jgi:predicted transglutaminase-like cysteine proteinase